MVLDVIHTHFLLTGTLYWSVKVCTNTKTKQPYTLTSYTYAYTLLLGVIMLNRLYVSIDILSPFLAEAITYTIGLKQNY